MADYTFIANAPTFDTSQQSNVMQNAYSEYRLAISLFRQKGDPMGEACARGDRAFTGENLRQARIAINDALDHLTNALQSLGY